MKENFKRDILKYIFYNIIGMLCISFYILVDTYFISYKLGVDGLVASNLALPFFSLNNALGIMIGIAYGNKFASLKSLGREEESLGTLANAMKIGVFFGLIFTLLGVFSTDKIGVFLGTDQTTHAMTTTYLRWTLLCSPIFLLNHIVMVFCKNDGNPKLAMLAMIISSLSNGFMDYVFMFRFGMGMLGAVSATCLAALISFLMIFVLHFLRKYKLELVSKFKIKLPDFKSLPDGIPSFVVEISSGILMFAFNMMILKISGNKGVAAYGVVTNILLVTMSIFNGLSQGVQPLMSVAYVQKDKNKLQMILNFSVKIAIAIALTLYALLFVFSRQISLIYLSENPEAIEIAINAIRIYFTGTAFLGLNLVAIMFLTMVDRLKQAFTISILRSVVLSVTFVVAMGYIFGMNGVWSSFLVTEMITFIVSHVYIRKIENSNVNY